MTALACECCCSGNKTWKSPLKTQLIRRGRVCLPLRIEAYISVVTGKALTDNLTAFVLCCLREWWCTFKRVSRSHSRPQSYEKQQDAKASSESSCSSAPSWRSAICFLLDDFVSLTTTESVIITAVRPTCASRRQHLSQIEALYSSRPKHQSLLKHHMFHVMQVNIKHVWPLKQSSRIMFSYSNTATEATHSSWSDGSL